MRGRRVPRAVVAAIALGTALSMAPATAQPLAAFLEAARTRNLENREQAALVARAQAQRDQVRAALLPSARATVSYTRNELEVVEVFTEEAGTPEIVTFVPLHQWNARIVIEAPLLDLGALREARASSAAVDSARLRAAVTEQDVARAVVLAYYEHAAAAALREAARAALLVAEANLEVVEVRFASGLASELERRRAMAEVARRRQAVAETDRATRDAARRLRTLTGLAPTGATPRLPDDLAAEEPLGSWLSGADGLVAVRAARSAVRESELRAGAAWLRYVPSLDAAFADRYTNAAGFGPRQAWAATITATWRLDADAGAAARAREAEARARTVRAHIAARDARARIESEWDRIVSLRARAAAAAAEEEAAALGAHIARTELAAGRVSLLELIQTERDAFDATARRVQALAELAYARAALRIAAGRADELAR